MHSLTASGQWAVDLLQCTASLSGAVGSATPAIHCRTAWGAVGSATPAMRRIAAWGQWAVERLQRTASLPGGSEQWNSCNALPHCLGPEWFVVLGVQCPWPLCSCSQVCPLRVLGCVCGVLGPLAPVHRCARSVCCFSCAVSWATWLLFTGVHARFVVLRVRCSGPLGSCSPVCPLCLLLSVRGDLGHLAPVHRCAGSVCYVVCAVSWAYWLLFIGVSAGFAVFGVRCPWPLGFYSPVRPLGLPCCMHGVLGPLAAVHRCARLVCFGACAVSWAPWLLFTSVPARCVVLCVRCPGPPGSCSPVCPLGVLCCVRGLLGHLALVHRCARSVRRVACTVSWAPWLLFTGVPAQCVVLRVRFHGPLGSCSPVRPLAVLCCVCSVLGYLAPVHQCARSVCPVACTVSWAPSLLFTGVPTWCVGPPHPHTRAHSMWVADPNSPPIGWAVGGGTAPDLRRP